MEFNMDIDTGGTLTDGFVRGNGRTELIKVDTTPHDLTVCFMECIDVLRAPLVWCIRL